MKFALSSAVVFLLTSKSAAAADASTSSPLANSYRLERLAVRPAGETTNNPPTYLHENPGDEAHLYQATTKVVDDDATTRQGNQPCSGTAVDFALHIANRFRVTLCLTPNDNDNSNNNYAVQVMGPMSSTRMYPMDEDVRDLEMEWSQALPTVTAATIQHDKDQRLTLTGPTVEILFQATDNVSPEEGSE